MSWPLVWGSREIQALRTVRRDSHQSLGEHIGASERTVRRWEKGGQPPTHKQLLRKLDETLAALEPWRREWFDTLRAQTRAPTVDGASNGSAGEEDDADRREANLGLSALLATAATAPLLGGALERIAHGGDRPVNAKLILAHEDLADALARMHMACRADVLLGPVARHADMLLALLDREMTSTDRRCVDATVVGSCAQAGLLGFLTGDRATARRYFTLATAVADDNGDDTLRAQALAFGSMLHSPIPTGGRGGDTRRSIAMLHAATHYLATASPGFNALVHRWLGQELAAAGDERGFHQAMETAEHLSGQPDHHDSRGISACYAAALNPGGAARDAGVGYVLLGRADRAVASLSAVRAGGNPRRTVTVLIEIGAARVLQGEPEEACRSLVRALDLALDAGYPMGIERIRGVRVRFPTGWAGLACVRELDERLRMVA